MGNSYKYLPVFNQNHRLLYIYLSRFVIAIHSTLGRRNANFGQAGADLRGGCRGCAPPPPEMTCGFLIQLVFCKKNYVVYWKRRVHPLLKKSWIRPCQELMSSSVFIWQVSIDHTFGSHRITHLAKLQEIAAVVPVYEKTYWPVYKGPLPSEKIWRAYVHRKEKIMNHSKNERIKSWWLHCGVVIGRDIYIYCCCH